MIPTAIIDTNVVVSGLVTSNPESLQGKILDGMLAGRWRFLLSPALLAEYGEVLARPKLRRYHRRTEEQIATILQAIRGQAIWREPEASSVKAPDPGDQHLWDLLADGPGAVLVTGDTLLLEKAPPGFSVLLPKDFLGIVADS